MSLMAIDATCRDHSRTSRMLRARFEAHPRGKHALASPCSPLTRIMNRCKVGLKVAVTFKPQEPGTHVKQRMYIDSLPLWFPLALTPKTNG